MKKRARLLPALALCCVTGCTDPGESQGPIAEAPPPARGKVSEYGIRVTDMLEEVIEAPSRARLQNEDAERQAQGLPPRFALPVSVSHAPSAATWQQRGTGELSWRMRIRSPGATSLSFGFSQYRLPHGAALHIYNDRERLRPFTDADNQAHGQLWTPILRGDEAVLELEAVPGSEASLALLLSTVNVGYREFSGPSPDSGSCNVDVVCAAGDGWRNEIRSVGVISTGGGTFCSGFLVNSEEGRSYFMTAYHCGIRAENAPSLVVYWNFETSTCGGTPNGKLEQFTTGATWRAGGAASDYTLVELNNAPAPEYNVYWSGWDATGTAPQRMTGIHHPGTDEKRISHSEQPGHLASYGEEANPGDATHWRVVDWTTGTTEPGSSGSGLWNQDHRIIGQLHGGGAACGNDLSDWYGALSVSYDAGAGPFLSPGGARTIDGRDQCPAPSVSIAVAPNPAQAGDSVSFTSTASGGAPPYTYAWDLDGDGAADCDTADCTRSYQGNVSTEVRLKVVDSAGCPTQRAQHLDVIDPACPPARSDAGALPIAIPDKGAIQAQLDGADRGKVSSLRVWVTIKHSYRGDLLVRLVSPGGKEVVLSDRAGGSAQDLVLDGVVLTGFAGEPSAGKWQLHVSDEAEADTGSLEAFAIELTGTCAQAAP